MPDNPFLIAQTVVWIICVCAARYWLARIQQSPSPPGDTHQIRHAPIILVVGVGGALFFAVLWVATMVWPDDSVGLFTHIAFPLLMLPGLLLVGDYYRTYYSVDAHGMSYATLFGRPGSFRWDEVEYIDFHRSMDSYRLRLNSGAVVRVSAWMTGLRALARHVATHVPPERIDEATRARLASIPRTSLYNRWR